MADHEVELEFDGATARPRFHCMAPPTADCRQTTLDPECSCEVIYDLIRDRHGTLIGHTLAGGEIFHGCGPGPGCSLIDWLENTEETLEGPALVTPRVPIEVAWRGEYYSWRAA
jgi:hypothetical protein